MHMYSYMYIHACVCICIYSYRIYMYVENNPGAMARLPEVGALLCYDVTKEAPRSNPRGPRRFCPESAAQKSCCRAYRGGLTFNKGHLTWTQHGRALGSTPTPTRTPPIYGNSQTNNYKNNINKNVGPIFLIVLECHRLRVYLKMVLVVLRYRW